MSSVTVTFVNPDIKQSVHGATGAGIRLGAMAGQAITYPCIAVDGVEAAGVWGERLALDIKPGAHQVEAYTKMKKGLKTKGRKGKAEFSSAEADSVNINVTFGQWITTIEVSIPGQALIKRRRFHG